MYEGTTFKMRTASNDVIKAVVLGDHTWNGVRYGVIGYMNGLPNIFLWEWKMVQAYLEEQNG